MFEGITGKGNERDANKGVHILIFRHIKII